MRGTSSLITAGNLGVNLDLTPFLVGIIKRDDLEITQLMFNGQGVWTEQTPLLTYKGRYPTPTLISNERAVSKAPLARKCRFPGLETKWPRTQSKKSPVLAKSGR